MWQTEADTHAEVRNRVTLSIAHLSLWAPSSDEPDHADATERGQAHSVSLAPPVQRQKTLDQLGFGQDVPWPLQLFCPAQLAFEPALQPLFPLHSFFPLQQSFAAGGVLSAAGAAAGGVLAAPPPQPARTPTRIPETADTARALPMFIFAFSPQEIWLGATPGASRGFSTRTGADTRNSYARTLLRYRSLSPFFLRSRPRRDPCGVCRRDPTWYRLVLA